MSRSKSMWPLRPPWEIPPRREAAACRHTSGGRSKGSGKQSGWWCDRMWYYVMWYYVIFCDIPIHVHALTFVYIYICVYSVSFAPRPSNKACLSLTMRVHWYNPSLDLLLTDVHVSSDGTATYASDCFEGPHSYSWTYPINTSITVMMAPRCIYIYVLPWVEKSW
jgi:hypothetical protein